MADYSINDITDGKTLPFSEFKLYFTSDTVEFKNLMEGASVTLKPVTQIDDHGMPIVVAYKIEATAVIYENNYEELLPALRLINKSVPNRVTLLLKGGSSQPNASQIDIQAVDTITEKAWGCYAELEANSEHPNLTIKIFGLFSTDLIDMTTNPLFNQYW